MIPFAGSCTCIFVKCTLVNAAFYVSMLITDVTPQPSMAVSTHQSMCSSHSGASSQRYHDSFSALQRSRNATEMSLVVPLLAVALTPDRAVEGRQTNVVPPIVTGIRVERV